MTIARWFSGVCRVTRTPARNWWSGSREWSAPSSGGRQGATRSSQIWRRRRFCACSVACRTSMPDPSSRRGSSRLRTASRSIICGRPAAGTRAGGRGGRRPSGPAGGAFRGSGGHGGARRVGSAGPRALGGVAGQVPACAALFGDRRSGSCDDWSDARRPGRQREDGSSSRWRCPGRARRSRCSLRR